MYLSKIYKKIICRQFRFCLIIGLILNIASAAQPGESGQLRMTQQEIINAKATGPTTPGYSNSSAII